MATTEEAATEKPAIKQTSSATAETETTAKTTLSSRLAGDPVEFDHSYATFDPDQEATCSTDAILNTIERVWVQHKQ